MRSRILLPMLLLLPATAALATFELKDPAAEMAADTPEANAAALEQIPCSEFLLAGASGERQSGAILDRMRRYHFDEGREAVDLPSGAEVKAYCIEHPKASLKAVADGLVP